MYASAYTHAKIITGTLGNPVSETPVTTRFHPQPLHTLAGMCHI